MRKFYSLVLMATALLIGTNVQAATVAKIGDTEYATFEEAWKAVKTGETIQLQANISISNTLWLGTATMGDETNVKSITLDLNGDTLSSTAQKMFVLSHGSLNVKNGVINHDITPELKSDGKGGNEYSSQIIVFLVYGSTYKDVDPANLEGGQDYYTHLTIGADVKVHAAVCGIVVDKWNSWIPTTALPTAGVTLPTTSAARKALYTNVYSSGNGVAHGVCIDVEGYIQARKYAIKANGNLSSPEVYKDKIGTTVSGKYSDRSNTPYVIAADDAKKYSPYIHIYGEKAKLLTTELTRTDAVAAYGGGYARWLVEGAVEGSTAVYVKSGEIELKNAQITSNFEGTASGSTADRSSGVDAGGSGLVIESSANYAGGTDVTVSGNTVITPTSGYALEEKITDAADTTKVDNVTIQGGTFKEGGAGTIVVTTQTAGTGSSSSSVTIDGGTFEFANETGGGVDLGGKSLEQFLTDQAVTSETTHTVVVETDDEGHQTIVISNGDKPTVANSVDGAAENASINWENTGVTTETLTDNKKLAELQISQNYNQTLIIPEGKTLEVGRVVLGAKAQIVVEAGAKFIVTGAQGLAAFQESNLVLKTQEGNPAIFLFNPAVTSNTHPMATVEFISKSYRVDNDHYAEQRFGIPTYGALTEVTAKAPTAPYAEIPTAFALFNYEKNKWERFGYIYTPGYTMDYSKMANSFDYYQLLNNTPNMGTIVTMKGELVGNASPELAIRGNFWNGFANSYMAPIDGAQLIDMIPNTVDKAFYLYDINSIQATWEPVTLAFLEDEVIQPMQPFLIRNTMAAADVTVDYTAAVYNPAMGIVPNSAPARRAESNMTKAKLIVKGENCIDRVGVVEGEEFSAEFDNGYDAAKYLNDGINMYVSADEKMSVYATDDLNNTYVGLQTVNGGNYTIEFAKVQGEELILIDHETGAQVAIVEGATYEFTAAANSVNDYRFEIVSAAKMPTAIENAEAVKSAKGIYTITGQYVGEMNVWNTLPAGIYVVNGEKLVK